MSTLSAVGRLFLKDRLWSWFHSLVRQDSTTNAREYDNGEWFRSTFSRNVHRSRGCRENKTTGWCHHLTTFHLNLVRPLSVPYICGGSGPVRSLRRRVLSLRQGRSRGLSYRWGKQWSRGLSTSRIPRLSVSLNGTRCVEIIVSDLRETSRRDTSTPNHDGPFWRLGERRRKDRGRREKRQKGHPSSETKVPSLNMKLEPRIPFRESERNTLVP